MSLVVDASVALRWYVEAPGSRAAVALLGRGETLVAPDLIVCELSNAAWKLARRGEISEEHGSSIAAAAATGFARLVPAAELAGQAWRIARELDHPVYDCLYLRLAEVRWSSMLWSRVPAMASGR